jgi:hypothetical protein
MRHYFPLEVVIGEPIAYLNLHRQHGSRHDVLTLRRPRLGFRGADFTLLRFTR